MTTKFNIAKAVFDWQYAAGRRGLLFAGGLEAVREFSNWLMEEIHSFVDPDCKCTDPHHGVKPQQRINLYLEDE